MTLGISQRSSTRSIRRVKTAQANRSRAQRTTKKLVSVIGCGSVGCAVAADLMDRGFDVCLYAHPKHSSVLKAIRFNGHLASEGCITGRHFPHCTTNIAEALRYARYILLALPSYAHRLVFKLMAPHLRRDHIVVLVCGNFGSLALCAQLGNTRPSVFETNVAPHASRVNKEGLVTILGTKKLLPIASFPTSLRSSIRMNIERLFSMPVEWNEGVLSIGLQANNGVIHPVATIMNAGWVETTEGDFYFYKDGISPAVGQLIECVDRERIEIGRRFGIRLRTLLDEMTDFYGEPFRTVAEFASGTKVHNLRKEAPSTLRHRYLLEDVPYILVTWYLLGRASGFHAKTIEAIITIASAANGTDYLATGRNLRDLGLAEMTRDQILSYVNTGLRAVKK